MPSTVEVDYLLDATRSSVKRFGGDGPTLSHLAYVLGTKWRSQFVEVFGENGPDDVKALLDSKSYVGDEDDVKSLLAEHDGTTAVLTALHDRLSSVIDGSKSAPESADEPVTESAEPTAVPSVTSADPINGWPERTRRYLTAVQLRDDLLERDDAITRVVSVVRQTRRRVPIILGRRGSGRTTLLSGVTHALSALPAADSYQVWRIAPETMGSDPEGPLRRIIEDCETPTVLLIDDIDQLAGLGTAKPNLAVLMLLRTAIQHPELRMVLTCDIRKHGRLETYVEDLAEQLAPIRLDPLSSTAISDVVDQSIPAIESTHSVKISAALRSLACLPPRSADNAVHPGLAIDRLDAAASHASVSGSSTADVANLAGIAARSSRVTRAQDLEDQFSSRISGQRNAIRTVAGRLALTLARLDLRPERPDGVFLFVGPTGVGKTELARTMSTAVYGAEDRLIRLDMSEYSHDWAVSRLVGPMPGYVGSTEPESWLTTKVAQMPECVILLDEIEKAHPTVWNTFLQVFDAGRLTDSRGAVADFSTAVIVMTSNLGAAEAAAPTLGFSNADTDLQLGRDRIVRSVKERMAPELINRIDEMVVFDPLRIDAIEEIAERELTQVRARLAESGWSVSYDAEVVRHLTTTGYDPAYGARHLQRNIERMFLGLIGQSQVKNVIIRAEEDQLTLMPLT